MSRNGSGYYYYNSNSRLWTIDGQGTLDSSNIYIGFNTAITNQKSLGIAIGAHAGFTNQGTATIAIGAYAGYKDQSSNAIAIGYNAGKTSQHANTIIINATGNDLSSNIANSLYISPIRESINNKALYYNTSTKEITYSDISDGNLNNYWTLVGSTIVNNNNGNVKITNTLDMSNNIVHDVSAIKFHDNYTITSGYFLGNSSTSLRLPLYQDTFVHPISVMRMSYFSNNTAFSIPANTGGIETLTPISLGTPFVNQVGLTFDASNIRFTIPNDISGQFIELYINIKDGFPNNGDYRIDISGTNNTLRETVGYVSTGGLTASALTFGPHSINNTEFYPGYTFMLVITSSKLINIQKTETIFKSHFI